jgi:leucyl aminopeptidase
VRFLGTMPPNELDTVEYGAIIKALSAKYHFQFKFHSNKDLKKMGAGAFTAVDQGNPDSQGGIFEITYSPKAAKNKNVLALVGKGLCYDTGGHDIKTGGNMLTMKGDMQGSAVALSTLVVAAELKIPLKMKAFLAVTENHISPKAYKADDVVIALNGTSIEVINTDAEGRMVLADALCLASRAKPEMILDFATLTGAATIALGHNFSAGFTNRDELHTKIIDAGRESGERVWTFPLDKDYGKPLESHTADIIQCIKGRGPDHIYAAYFLKEFVGKDIPWVHIDLSASDKDGGLAHVDSVFTGFGVRWTLQFLKNKYKIS